MAPFPPPPAVNDVLCISSSGLAQRRCCGHSRAYAPGAGASCWTSGVGSRLRRTYRPAGSGQAICRQSQLQLQTQLLMVDGGPSPHTVEHLVALRHTVTRRGRVRSPCPLAGAPGRLTRLPCANCGPGALRVALPTSLQPTLQMLGPMRLERGARAAVAGTPRRLFCFSIGLGLGVEGGAATRGPEPRAPVLSAAQPRSRGCHGAVHLARLLCVTQALRPSLFGLPSMALSCSCAHLECLFPLGCVRWLQLGKHTILAYPKPSLAGGGRYQLVFPSAAWPARFTPARFEARRRRAPQG